MSLKVLLVVGVALWWLFGRKPKGGSPLLGTSSASGMGPSPSANF